MGAASGSEGGVIDSSMHAPCGLNVINGLKPLLLLTRRAGQADMATGDRLVVASRALVADGAGIQAVDVCQTRPDMVTFVPGGRQR